MNVCRYFIMDGFDVVGYFLGADVTVFLVF